MKALFCLLIIGFLCLPIGAQETGNRDIVLHLRFYLGQRGQETQRTDVITTYSLRPLFVGSLVSESSLQEERAELQRIFHLTGLVAMAQAQWGWEGGKPGKRFQMIVLNDHEFLLQVSKQMRRDDFRVEVISREEAGNKTLMETEVVLPERKSSVMGFEDSLGKPYFLALQREADSSTVREETGPKADLGVPRLVHRVNPALSAAMLQAMTDGLVTLEVKVNDRGEVSEVYAVAGDPSLSAAAMKAVKQWKYEPFLDAGKPVPLTFAFNVFFRKSGAVERVEKWHVQTLAAEPIGLSVRERVQKRKGAGFRFEVYEAKLEDVSIQQLVATFGKLAGVPIRIEPSLPENIRFSCDARGTTWDVILDKLLVIRDLEVIDDGAGLVVRRPGGFSGEKPVAGYITSIFGERRSPFSGKLEFHDGVDIATKQGVPVSAVGQGTVAFADFRGKYGNLVIVDHGYGYATWYAKLAEFRVKAGERVKAGQAVGTVGSTGVSTAPHLHFEVRWNDKPQNPFRFIRM